MHLEGNLEYLVAANSTLSSVMILGRPAGVALSPTSIRDVGHVRVGSPPLNTNPKRSRIPDCTSSFQNIEKRVQFNNMGRKGTTRD